MTTSRTGSDGRPPEPGTSGSAGADQTNVDGDDRHLPPPLESIPAATIDPLPHRFATTGEGIGGRIKVRPEDFLVDELPLYEPTGSGEHLMLCVQKSNTSHAELMSVLRKHFGVEDSAIGFGGMKDKVGVTRQMVTVHLPGREVPPTDFQHARVAALWAARHANKMRVGHLAGNRFSIRIRDVNPMSAPRALAILRQLEGRGVPNYFGPQRFGYRGNNHVLGAYALRGQWRSACSLLLGQEGGRFQEHQRERRALYDRGRYAEAGELWTPADRNEFIVSRKLARGARPRDAALAIGHSAFNFWISALQSAIFNRVLDQRIADGRLFELVEGDIACKHENRSMFHVTREAIDSGELPERMRNQEISPTGPLWGPGMLRANGLTARCEEQALSEAGFSVEEFLSFRRVLEGQRRPLTVPLRHATLEAGLDEFGEFVRVAFDLPRGSYATVVLREIMRHDSERTMDDDDHA